MSRRINREPSEVAAAVRICAAVSRCVPRTVTVLTPSSGLNASYLNHHEYQQEDDCGQDRRIRPTPATSTSQLKASRPGRRAGYGATGLEAGIP